MTDAAATAAADVAVRISRTLKRRHRAERGFRVFGVVAIVVALTFLGLMFLSIATKGWSAFQQTSVRLDIHFDETVIDPEGTRDPETLSAADYQGLVKAALRRAFPDVRKRRDKRKLYKLVSQGAAFELRRLVLDDPAMIGRTEGLWLPASDDVDMVMKGRIRTDIPESDRPVSDKQLAWIADIEGKGALEKRFNVRFFTGGDSREPELAGIMGAVVGSLFSLAVCLALSFPVGVLTAVYLEEFAPKNRWTDWIEININNLAAVPSIIFGLLGLAMFLGVFGLPRSASIVGGMVLALMTLPTIIVAGRSSIKAVPPSIRYAALAIGASPMQTVFHHVLPLAMPGVLTGTIIGMARALGETAPLLMIGMVAFIVDIPRSILDPATALPVQIFLWADSPERAFEERTAAAIICLLVFLVCMNLLAVVLRQKFERRW